MSYKGQKIAVVMPAYNAGKTLQRTYDDLPLDLVDDVILVDDASRDNTVDVAKTLPIEVIVHPQNLGYGGNQKTCYRAAVARGANIIVMVHPDHQYDPKFIPEMVQLMVDKNIWAVFGSRMTKRRQALASGMPWWKWFFNIFLTQAGNLLLGTRLTELHSGFRAYDRRVFEKIDIAKNSNDFIFDTQIIIQLVAAKISIAEVPISTRYFDEASQINFRRSVVYGFGILWNVLLFRLGLKKF
jgi:glycosyltransferase involved in cell wall biosynthesis